MAKDGLLPMEAAYAYQKDSPETQELIAIDLQRDEAIIGIVNNAESFTHHFDAAKQQAGQTIVNCMNKYGKRVHKMAYAIETEIVSKLITDLQTNPAISAAVTTLGLADWVNYLKDSNDQFNIKYLERTKAYAQKPSQSSSGLKPAAIAAFAVLEQQINSNSNPEIDTTGKYTTLVGNLNALTNQANTDANRRIAATKSSGNAAAAITPNKV